MFGIFIGFYYNNEIIRRMEWCICYYLVYDRCYLMNWVLVYRRIFDNWNGY